MAQTLRSTWLRLVGTSLLLSGAGLLLGVLAVAAALVPNSTHSLPTPVALRQANLPSLSERTPVATPTHLALASNRAASVNRLEVANPRAPDASRLAGLQDTSPPDIASIPGAVERGDPERVDTTAPLETGVDEARDRAGLATWLSIPSIELETAVEQGGFVFNADGSVYPRTLPFVAVHYGWHTAAVGGPGNAVIAGHVVTLHEGNVFRDLYRVELGDEVQVRADGGAIFTYRVHDVALLPPSAVEVMQPADDARLTLITCGGTFDPSTRTFSDRLVVTALLAERGGQSSE